MSPATPPPASLPADFLTTAAPATLTCTRVDFAQASLSEYAGKHAWVLDNVLTAAECRALLSLAAARTGGAWERAMVNVGNGRQMLATEARNCGRIIWDDGDVVARIWARVAPRVPEILALEGEEWGDVYGWGPVRRRERWVATRLNERMRFLKYQGGEYFRPHCDGTYVTPDGKERSYFTLHLYLNDADTTEEGDEPLEGGATTFHSYADRSMLQVAEPEEYNKKLRMDVVPKAGRVLLFQHRDLIHSGDDVVRGTKLTMRTDLMYKLDESGPKKDDMTSFSRKLNQDQSIWVDYV